MAHYRVVPELSYIWMDGRSNVHAISATTNGLEGYIDLVLSPDGRVDVTEPAEGLLSLSVEHLSSGHPAEDRELHRRIDSRRFPKIEASLRKIVPANTDDSYEVSGDITFRGVTQPHDDVMSISSVDAETIQLEGQSSFDIRRYGMEPPRLLLLKVQPEVEIRIQVSAVRAS